AASASCFCVHPFRSRAAMIIEARLRRKSYPRLAGSSVSNFSRVFRKSWIVAIRTLSFPLTVLFDQSHSLDQFSFVSSKLLCMLAKRLYPDEVLLAVILVKSD